MNQQELKTSTPEDDIQEKTASVDNIWNAYLLRQKELKRKERIKNRAANTAFIFINGGFALVIGWIFWLFDMMLFTNYDTWSILGTNMKPSLFLWVLLAFFFPSLILTYRVFKVLRIDEH